MTATYTFLRWLDDPASGHGLHFERGPGEWEFWSEQRLAELAGRAAAAMAARGVGRGDVVMVVHRSDPGFIASLFGTMLAGATPCSAAPPFALQRADEYQAHIGQLVRVARPALTITDGESREHLTRVTAGLRLPGPTCFEELVAGVPREETGTKPPALGADDTALLQFTSGSSAPKRGVRITAAALEANVTAMSRWLRWSPGDRGVSWLPVHHDMGLVGCLITPMAVGCVGWLMQPEDFIRTPVRYLRLLSEQRARMTAMPGFGLAYLLSRVRPGSLSGMDFSALDALVLGAERIPPRLLDSFHEFLAPYGLRRTALLPAYGLAEATLSVTGLPLGEGWVSSRPCGPGAGAGAPCAAGATTDVSPDVTGCGRPVHGTAVRVVGEDGAPVPDGVPGEIVVSGRSLAAGYAGDRGSSATTRLNGHELRTGDAGFLRDGQLFVLGRLGDGLKMRGRMVFAEALELELQERGLPAHRAVALLGMSGDRHVAAVVIEKPRANWTDLAIDVLRSRVPGADLLVIDAPRGAIAVTTSGKPRRRAMWRALTEGNLPGRVVATQPPQAAKAARATGRATGREAMV
jgi:acyl-CoA synthetase (AMP-forming)/AMP-acid ligase II